MGKERQSNREAKKKPAKTLTEKRAAKKARKQEQRGFSIPTSGQPGGTGRARPGEA
jgi:hypothetical protein